MMPALEVLAMAAVMAGPPAPPLLRPAMPWVAIHRREVVHAGREASAAWRMAARLGASLAWDLADLPGHQTGATQPWGAYQSSHGYSGAPVQGAFAPGGGGAIGALITHWNTVHPPYALEAMDDRERLGRRNDHHEEPSCPGN